jgi:plasmid stabilization system protein ParE
MSYSITFSERAFSELLDSWAWYEDRQDGLGDEFKKVVFRKLAQVAVNPEIGTPKKRSYYEITIKRFPYIVIYRIEKRSKTVFVSSLFHTSRAPKNKYK